MFGLGGREMKVNIDISIVPVLHTLAGILTTTSTQTQPVYSPSHRPRPSRYTHHHIDPDQAGILTTGPGILTTTSTQTQPVYSPQDPAGILTITSTQTQPVYSPPHRPRPSRYTHHHIDPAGILTTISTQPVYSPPHRPDPPRH